MGVTGLLPTLAGVAVKRTLSSYAGQTLCVDGYAWLHKCVFQCGAPVALGLEEGSSVWLENFMKRIQHVTSLNINLIIVFDGMETLGKLVEGDRSESRRQHRMLGVQSLLARSVDDAKQSFEKSLDISFAMARRVIGQIQRHFPQRYHPFYHHPSMAAPAPTAPIGNKAIQSSLHTSFGSTPPHAPASSNTPTVDWLIAPHEADPQLAYLVNSGVCDAAITEDSDLIPLGCSKTLFKLKIDYKHRFGSSVEEVTIHDVLHHNRSPYNGMTLSQLQAVCVISGCDYSRGIVGYGAKKAVQLVKKYMCLCRILDHFDKTSTSLTGAQLGPSYREFVRQYTSLSLSMSSTQASSQQPQIRNELSSPGASDDHSASSSSWLSSTLQRCIQGVDGVDTPTSIGAAGSMGDSLVGLAPIPTLPISLSSMGAALPSLSSSDSAVTAASAHLTASTSTNTPYIIPESTTTTTTTTTSRNGDNTETLIASVCSPELDTQSSSNPPTQTQRVPLVYSKDLLVYRDELARKEELLWAMLLFNHQRVYRLHDMDTILSPPSPRSSQGQTSDRSLPGADTSHSGAPCMGRKTSVYVLPQLVHLRRLPECLRISHQQTEQYENPGDNGLVSIQNGYSALPMNSDPQQVNERMSTVVLDDYPPANRGNTTSATYAGHTNDRYSLSMLRAFEQMSSKLTTFHRVMPLSHAIDRTRDDLMDDYFPYLSYASLLHSLHVAHGCGHGHATYDAQSDKHRYIHPKTHLIEAEQGINAEMPPLPSDNTTHTHTDTNESMNPFISISDDDYHEDNAADVVDSIDTIHDDIDPNGTHQKSQDNGTDGDSHHSPKESEDHPAQPTHSSVETTPPHPSTCTADPSTPQQSSSFNCEQCIRALHGHSLPPHLFSDPEGGGSTSGGGSTGYLLGVDSTHSSVIDPSIRLFLRSLSWLFSHRHMYFASMGPVTPTSQQTTPHSATSPSPSAIGMPVKALPARDILTTTKLLCEHCSPQQRRASLSRGPAPCIVLDGNSSLSDAAPDTRFLESNPLDDGAQTIHTGLLATDPRLGFLLPIYRLITLISQPDCTLSVLDPYIGLPHIWLHAATAQLGHVDPHLSQVAEQRESVGTRTSIHPPGFARINTLLSKLRTLTVDALHMDRHDINMTAMMDMNDRCDDTDTASPTTTITTSTHSSNREPSMAEAWNSPSPSPTLTTLASSIASLTRHDLIPFLRQVCELLGLHAAGYSLVLDEGTDGLCVVPRTVSALSSPPPPPLGTSPGNDGMMGPDSRSPAHRPTHTLDAQRSLPATGEDGEDLPPPSISSHHVVLVEHVLTAVVNYITNHLSQPFMGESNACDALNGEAHSMDTKAMQDAAPSATPSAHSSADNAMDSTMDDALDPRDGWVISTKNLPRSKPRRDSLSASVASEDHPSTSAGIATMESIQGAAAGVGGHHASSSSDDIAATTPSENNGAITQQTYSDVAQDVLQQMDTLYHMPYDPSRLPPPVRPIVSIEKSVAKRSDGLRGRALSESMGAPSQPRCALCRDELYVAQCTLSLSTPYSLFHPPCQYNPRDGGSLGPNGSGTMPTYTHHDTSGNNAMSPGHTAHSHTAASTNLLPPHLVFLTEGRIYSPVPLALYRAHADMTITKTLCECELRRVYRSPFSHAVPHHPLLTIQQKALIGQSNSTKNHAVLKKSPTSLFASSSTAAMSVFTPRRPSTTTNSSGATESDHKSSTNQLISAFFTPVKSHSSIPSTRNQSSDICDTPHASNAELINNIIDSIPYPSKSTSSPLLYVLAIVRRAIYQYTTNGNNPVGGSTTNNPRQNTKNRYNRQSDSESGDIMVTQDTDLFKSTTLLHTASHRAFPMLFPHHHPLVLDMLCVTPLLSALPRLLTQYLNSHWDENWTTTGKQLSLHTNIPYKVQLLQLFSPTKSLSMRSVDEVMADLETHSQPPQRRSTGKKPGFPPSSSSSAMSRSSISRSTTSLSAVFSMSSPQLLSGGANPSGRAAESMTMVSDTITRRRSSTTVITADGQAVSTLQDTFLELSQDISIIADPHLTPHKDTADKPSLTETEQTKREHVKVMGVESSHFRSSKVVRTTSTSTSTSAIASQPKSTTGGIAWMNHKSSSVSTCTSTAATEFYDPRVADDTRYDMVSPASGSIHPTHQRHTRRSIESSFASSLSSKPKSMVSLSRSSTLPSGTANNNNPSTTHVAAPIGRSARITSVWGSRSGEGPPRNRHQLGLLDLQSDQGSDTAGDIDMICDETSEVDSKAVVIGLDLRNDHGNGDNDEESSSVDLSCVIQKSHPIPPQRSTTHPKTVPAKTAPMATMTTQWYKPKGRDNIITISLDASPPLPAVPKLSLSPHTTTMESAGVDAGDEVRREEAQHISLLDLDDGIDIDDDGDDGDDEHQSLVIDLCSQLSQTELSQQQEEVPNPAVHAVHVAQYNSEKQQHTLHPRLNRNGYHQTPVDLKSWIVSAAKVNHNGRVPPSPPRSLSSSISSRSAQHSGSFEPLPQTRIRYHAELPLRPIKKQKSNISQLPDESSRQYSLLSSSDDDGDHDAM